MFRHILFLSVGFFTLFFLVTGCRDTKINPYEENTGIYSIYGAINLHETEHVIRVRDLNVFHQDSTSINLDATVTFFDLEKGTSQVLRDSIVLFPENYTHNFLLNKEFAPRAPYRVVVERSDGASVSSNFTTPGVTEAHIFPFDEDLSCFKTVLITFRNLLPSEQIRWEIGFSHDDEIHWRELTNFCPQSYYPERNELIVSMDTRGLLNTIFPPPMDNASCRFAADPVVSCRDLDSNEVQLRFLHLGPEWNLIFPVRPSDPVDVGDVENGLGFLGAYRRGTLSYTVLPD